MGGKFIKCADSCSVKCIRHNWKLNVEKLEYETPTSMKKEGLMWEIKDNFLEIYEKGKKGQEMLVTKEFRIKFYSHACMEIKWRDYSFFTDPWLVGPAFTKGWWLTSEPPEDWLEKLAKCDGIYFSHNHSDHMNIPTLKQLVKENPFVPIFIPGFESDSCFEILSSIGFKNIRICEFGEEQGISGAKFTIYQDTACREDSGILFEYKGHKILNTVDCKNIKKYDICDVDVLLTEFSSGASGYPVCWGEQYDLEEINKMLDRNRRQMYRNVIDTIRHFKPKMYIPFAGYFSEEYWSDNDIKQMNIKNCPKELCEFIENKITGVKTWLPESGKELDIGDFSSYEYKGNWYVDKSSDYYLKDIKNGEHIQFYNNKENIQKYFDEVGYRSDLLLHVIEKDEEFLFDHNEFFVDFNTGKVVYYKPEEFKRYLRIKVRSDVFRYVLYNRLPWEEFSIGFQARFYREPDNYNFDFWDYFQNSIPKTREIYV
tara:strand:+ start:2910 stop:4361 length:1452 start_codon:yes stop_codon:yes gene_type:complete